MDTQNPRLTRRLALGAFAGATLMTALPARALGGLTHVRAIDRDRNQVMPLYQHRGDLWLAGEPGRRYALELVNLSGGRLLNVVSVDGVNVITGETADYSQSGYVLNPGQRYDVSGWRKSRRDVAVFRFATLTDSYAARTGRFEDVGVIGVAVFREKERRPDHPYWLPQGDWPPASGRSAPGAQGKSMPWGGQAPLGTAHGERESDRVGTTEFERRHRRPDEVVLIRYDSYANLVARGIVPEPRHHEHRRPHPFPGARPGFVPDPY